MLLLSLALAQESFVGLPVATVTLEAPRGGLPDESLHSLLRSRQGHPYDPQATRQDLTTLMRVGDFAAVEAHAEPWYVTDDNGNNVPAVNVTYQVLPAPRVRKLRVQGHRAFNANRLLDAAGITAGQAFYPELDSPEAAARAQAWMRRQGWVEAEVEVDPIQVDEDGFEVWVRVFEGQPNVLTELHFVGDVPPSVGVETLTRWAREAGVKVGKPISSAAIEDATYAIRSHLGRVTGNLLEPARGWIGARITWTVKRDDDGRVTLTIAVEPGPRLELAVTGLRYRAKRRVRDALGVDERLRLTRGFVDEADARLEAALQRKGFYDADAIVELRGGGDTQTLYVEVDRGERHHLRVLPQRRSLTFEGNTVVSQRQLTRAADQASPDVIRLDRYTEPELERGLRAMRNLYAARGHQDAKIELKEVREDGRRLVPILTVDEGPATAHGAIRIEGAAIELQDLEKAARLREGQPFDPAALERVARQLLEAHRQQGYLQADVAVRHLPAGEQVVDTTITVTPGPLVRLRSVALRGLRHTSPWFVRRELELVRGAPLTTTDLERTRRQLYGLGIFRSVGIDLLGEGTARDLLITVDERARWGAEAGFGLNTDQGARVFARGIRRNLWGIGHRLDAHGLFGITYASGSLGDWSPDWKSLAWRMAFRYTAPHFPWRNSEVVFDLLLQERFQQRTWRMARTGAGVTLELKLGRYTRLSTSLRGELRDLQQYDPRALLPGEPWKVLDAQDPSKGCYPCRLADSLKLVLVHDRRNDPIQPTRGFLVSAIAEGAPGIPWQNEALIARFAKGELRAVGFVPLGPLTLQLSAEVGHAYAITGTIPLEDRYRLGGTGSMRGFSLQSVGPRNRAESVVVTWPSAIAPVLEKVEAESPERWIPTGGDTQGIGIVELNLPFSSFGLAGWDGYSVALFEDVGNVWHLGPGAPSTRGLAGVPVVRSASGIGLRVATPIGPLQLDLAGNNQRMFSRGAQQVLLKESWKEPMFRAHLSLGTLW